MLPGLRVAAGAAIIAVLATAPPGAAPQRESVLESEFAPAALEMRADEWRAAVRAHAGGEMDAAAATVARWPARLTRIVVDRAIRRAREKNVQEAALAKGLLLHTDLAMAEGDRETSGGGAAGASSLLDAKPTALRQFSAHWGLSRELAAALAKDAATAPVARAWFRAACAFFQRSADLGQLRAYLDAAADALPDDPVLLLYRGSLHQGFADARVQAYLAPFRNAYGALPPRLQMLAIDKAETELATAERALRRALAIDADLAEARIRLAHVMDARGRSAEAATSMRDVLASPLPAFLEYYAAMVLGRAEARLGRHAVARAAFDRATSRYPHSQAAQVALSHANLAEGRANEGVAALMEALGPAAADADDDPWAFYFRDHDPDATSRYDEFRRSVR